LSGPFRGKIKRTLLLVMEREKESGCQTVIKNLGGWQRGSAKGELHESYYQNWDGCIDMQRRAWLAQIKACRGRYGERTEEKNVFRLATNFPGQKRTFICGTNFVKEEKIKKKNREGEIRKGGSSHVYPF